MLGLKLSQMTLQRGWNSKSKLLVVSWHSDSWCVHIYICARHTHTAMRTYICINGVFRIIRAQIFCYFIHYVLLIIQVKCLIFELSSALCSSCRISWPNCWRLVHVLEPYSSQDILETKSLGTRPVFHWTRDPFMLSSKHCKKTKSIFYYCL